MIVVGFVVAAAGGTLLRWRVAELLPRPMGTLLVNLAGAFALGWLTGSSTTTRTVLGIAAIGSLTTFSTLVIEVLDLVRERPRRAGLYVIATFGGGIGLAWLGITIA